MKISENWLREWVNPALDAVQIGEQLTMAGLELDDIATIAQAFSGVVVGQVLELEPHPDADRLRVAKVDVGQDEPLQIVCGAPNVAVGIKAPVALVGAVLPAVDGKPFVIKKGKLRGVASEGMLCGGSEIDCDDGIDGLLILSDDAPIGKDVREYLGLDNQVLDIAITPNRGDCFSVRGIAREVALANELPFCEPFERVCLPQTGKLIQTVSVQTSACPRYIAQVVAGLSAKTPSPQFIKQALTASGIKPKNLLVDVTNYVLMELGQPLHAFDKNKLVGDISVRIAQAGEQLMLLNGTQIDLIGDELVICDEAGVIALAGIMGGLRTAVDDTTTQIVLESAFFDPLAIAGRARRFGLHTDASQRFERGVDFELPDRAIDRAVWLLHTHGGGEVHQKTLIQDVPHLPKRFPISVMVNDVTKRLGCDIDAQKMLSILNALDIDSTLQANTLIATPPSHRFDISIKEDIIEEIARIYGYDNIPNQLPNFAARLFDNPSQHAVADIKSSLVGQGYFEAVSFSFVDQKLERCFDGDLPPPLVLANPISSELAVMRRTVLSSLLPCVLYNQNRQQNRVRLFETGLVFLKDAQLLNQTQRLGMVAIGSVAGESPWAKDKPMDFFEFKADVESILKDTTSSIHYRRSVKPFLHGGQSADVYVADQLVGYFGQLHPKITKQLELPITWVAEFELEALIALHQQSVIMVPSRFPSVRRDFAFVVDKALAWQDVADVVAKHAGQWHNQTVLFDVYADERLGASKQSIAFGVIWQHQERTLTDDEIKRCANDIVLALEQSFDAKLRDANS